VSTERDPATDQPAPTPAPAHVDGVHVAAMRSICMRPIDTWTRAAAIDLLQDRYRLGLAKYGTVLHPGNGRDHLRDLLEELADAVAYAHCLDESPANNEIVNACESALVTVLEMGRRRA
jgi:hypothetical protein